MERAAWVALSALPGLGPARFRRLVEAFGSPLEALSAAPEELRTRADLPESLLEHFADIAPQLESVAEELASLDEQGMRALTWEDAEYPRLLLTTSSPPPVLWHVGPTDLNNPRGAVAVVGSREASEQGVESCRKAAEELAGAGIAVISGLAAGIDAAAHEGALEAAGPTIGVCGCGLLTALTRGAEGLAGRVAEAGGLCSELMPTAPLLPQTLYARNRIIAGLAEAVVVAEARAEGGAVHTAKCAKREGRPVVVMTGLDGDSAAGNRQLLREGALPLEMGESVLETLRRVRGRATGG